MIRIFKTRWYLIGLFFVIFFVAFNFQKSKSNSKKNKQLYRVKKETLKEILSLSGEIDADEKATLRFQTSGRLAWVGVKEGDYVKKYQTIASLDQRSLRKTLEKHLRDYMKERWDFEEDKNVTYKDMPLTDTIKRILEKNQFDLDKAVLDVELQNIALEYSTLWTPIEGVVTRIDAPFAGVNITPAQAEFEIVNPKTIYFSATAEQADVVNLKEGLKGKIIFDAFPETYQGEIYFISFAPQTGETGVVYQLKIKLDDQAIKLPLKLAMTGDIEFLVKEKKDALSIPVSYVKQNNKGNYVYMLKNNKKVKKYIVLGEEIDGKYEIKKGVNEGDLIYD